MSAAQAAVLGDDNLLRLIAANLPRASIALLRLTCRSFEKECSPYLFTVLRLRFSSWYLQRVRWIAARKKFRKGVREIIFDTATYLNPDGTAAANVSHRESSVGMLITTLTNTAGLHSSNLGQIYDLKTALLQRSHDAAIDEMRTVAACTNDYVTIENALGRLKWCRKLTITT